jgi:hypothetical protein
MMKESAGKRGKTPTAGIIARREVEVKAFSGPVIRNGFPQHAGFTYWQDVVEYTKGMQSIRF